MIILEGFIFFKCYRKIFLDHGWIKIHILINIFVQSLMVSVLMIIFIIILKRVVVYRIDDQDPKYDLIRNGWLTSFPAVEHASLTANIVNDIERGKLIYNKNGNLIKLNNMDVSELLSADHAKILHQDKMLIHKNVIHLLFDITNFFNIIGYYPRIIISNKRFKNPFSTIEQIRLDRYK